MPTLIKRECLNVYTSMNWSKDSLLSKAKVFMEKAFQEDKDSPYFGIFSALGLELLARAAVANVHPVLLAEPDITQKNALYALELNGATSSPKSIMTKHVINLCGILVPEFNTDLQKLALAMTEVRNEELHTGGAAFLEYNQDYWISGFYKACQVLAESMGESLISLFGKDRAAEAKTLVSEGDALVKKTVMDRISARKKTFEEDLQSDRGKIEGLIERTKKEAFAHSHYGYHIVDCPCCGNLAWIHGKESLNSHDEIQERCHS